MDRSFQPLVCAVPGCGRKLYKFNRSGVCRAHNHAEIYCQCGSCGGKPVEPRISVRPMTRAEAVEAGLLPVAPVFGRTVPREPSMPVAPWKAAK